MHHFMKSNMFLNLTWHEWLSCVGHLETYWQRWTPREVDSVCRHASKNTSKEDFINKNHRSQEKNQTTINNIPM